MLLYLVCMHWLIASEHTIDGGWVGAIDGAIDGDIDGAILGAKEGANDDACVCVYW